MESARDPELGHASIVVKADQVPQSPQDGFQYSATLVQPLLQDTPISVGSAVNEDTLPTAISDSITKVLPQSVYEPQSTDHPSILEFKAEVRRWLGRLSLSQEWMLADDEFRCRMSRSVTRVSASHFAFMIAMCVAVYGYHVDGKPGSVAYWLMLVELAVLLSVLAVKMVAMYEYENRKQPESLSLKLNLQNMPTLREFLGEQEFKNFTESFQKQVDRISACVLVESMAPSFCDFVKSYFKRWM